MFNYSNSHRKENKSPLKREHILQLEALEERALLSALPWNTGVADTVPAIVAPAAVQNNVIISPLTLEVPQALESDPGVISEGIYTFNEIDYNAHEIECLQTFFEQTDDNEVTNGVNLFGESYDVNDPATWFNNENQGATFTDVDGVQRLTALNLENGSNLVGDLDVSDCTELATLNLSGMSALTSLNISGCTSITGKLDIYQLGLMSLTALDVSGCTSLESLFAYVHGSLVTLNASGCTSLDYLGAYEDANLVSVDVSGCTALTGLDCLANPNMTELKMSGCPAIQTMSCSNTLLTSLDVSECTELVQLECNGTQLTVLDLSGCAALEYLVCWNANLECVIINPELEYVYIELYDDNYDTTWTFQDANETILSTESTYYEYSAENVSALPITVTNPDETQTIRIFSSEMAKLRAFFELANGEGTNGTKLFGETYDANVPATWHNDDNKGATFTNVDGVMRLTALNLENGSNLVGQLDVSDCTELATLNVVGLSALTSLNISGCTAMTGTLNVRSLTALTTLNMSGCTAITRVNASNLGALTTLNASGCTSLTNLSAFSDSQLTSLDASGCTALKNLDCHECQLTSLTVSGCTALEDLTCQTNQLTSLDVSDCTALTYLECADNQLTSLDVSGCTELGELICQGNQFTKLDVSECTELSDLSCWTANLDCILISQEQTGLSIDLDEWKGNDRKWTFQTANGTVTTGISYTYQNTDMLPVVATNADETQTVAIAVETTPLAAPTMSEGTVEMSKVSFTWDAVPNANGYQFEYKAVGSEEWLTKTVNKTSASFVGELGVEYTARVKAIGKGLYTDSEYSDEQAVPQLEIVTTFNAKKVTVSWLDESPAADTIRYRVAGTEKWTTKKLKAGVTSFTFSPKAGTNYEVQVLRDQQEGNILQGPIVMLDQAKLKADKAQIQYDSFQVNVTNYTAKNLADNATQAILTVNGVQTTVDIEDQFGESDLANGGKVTFENGLFTFTDMASNTKYNVQVSFTDDVSVSTMSKLSVKTLKASYEAPVVASATALTDTCIEVTWETSHGQKTDTPAQKYTVQYSLDGNKWSNATTGATGNAYTIQKLKGGNLYKVRVLATKDNAFNASVASAVFEAETLATPKMALVKGTVTSSTFQISVANYATTNLVIATTLNVRSDQFGDVVIIVVNGTGSATFGNGMTVAFENGSLTFEHAPANTQQKIQISFGNGVCTTAWSSALSVKTAKAL